MSCVSTRLKVTWADLAQINCQVESAFERKRKTDTNGIHERYKREKNAKYLKNVFEKKELAKMLKNKKYCKKSLEEASKNKDEAI